MAETRAAYRDLESRELRIPSLGDLPVNGLRFLYDLFADARYVDFYGTSLPSPGTSRKREDHAQIWIRTDFDTDRATGIHGKNVFISAVAVDPWLGDALLVAEYPDSDEQQSAAIRKRAAERISQPWSDERFLDQLRRVVNEEPNQADRG